MAKSVVWVLTLLVALAASVEELGAEEITIPLVFGEWEKIRDGDWEETAEGLRLFGLPYRRSDMIYSKSTFDLSGGGWVRTKFRMGDGSTYQAGDAMPIHGTPSPDYGAPQTEIHFHDRFFTTHHSFMGSYVVTPGVWYYVRRTMAASGSVEIFASTGDYDDRGGNVIFINNVDFTDHLEYLQSVRVLAAYNDNYGVANAYFELGEAVVSTAFPPIDPEDPPAHTSQYNFVMGAQPYVQWNGITVGLDFALSIPTMDPIQYNPSITYPEEAIIPELDPWETEFHTNNRILGALLSAAAPIEFNALELTGTARLSADAVAEAGIYLENAEDHADIGASIGAGLNLTLNLEASSDLLNGLPKQLRDMLPTEFTFKYLIAGTPIFTTPEIEVPLGDSTFDIDAFRQAIADFDPTDDYQTADDVTGSVTISYDDVDVPMNFRDTSGDGKPDEVSVTIGASASNYAETSATAGVDFFFKEIDEYGQVVQSNSIFETLGHLWNQTIELTDATVVRSDTGTVEIHLDGLLELVTGSPVWMTTIVDTEEETNLLAFEADFVSGEGAEGILQVFWDSELVATIDERMVGDEEETFLFALSDTFGPGAYTLSFRLDSFTDIASNVLIDNITTGYMASVPEPATLTLLALGGLAMLKRRRY